MKKDKALYKLVSNLWKNGTSWTEKYKKFYNYYDGKLNQNYFGGEEKTSNNIIDEIVETKTKEFKVKKFDGIIVQFK